MRRISCESPQRIVGAINVIMPHLAPDIGRRLNKIERNYSLRYGIEGLYQRVNNRTVAEILAEYSPTDDVTPIVSGEVDGLRYELYEPPTVDRKRDDLAEDK